MEAIQVFGTIFLVFIVIPCVLIVLHYKKAEKEIKKKLSDPSLHYQEVLRDIDEVLNLIMQEVYEHGKSSEDYRFQLSIIVEKTNIIVSYGYNKYRKNYDLSKDCIELSDKTRDGYKEMIWYHIVARMNANSDIDWSYDFRNSVHQEMRISYPSKKNRKVI